MAVELRVKTVGKRKRVEDRARERRAPRPLGLVVEKSHVETVVVGYENGIAHEFPEFVHDLFDAARVGDHVVVDTGQRLNGGRDRFIGANECLEVVGDHAGSNEDRANLDDATAARTAAGGFNVNGDEFAMCERRSTEHRQ